MKLRQVINHLNLDFKEDISGVKKQIKNLEEEEIVKL
jgi:hypothetical protein